MSDTVPLTSSMAHRRARQAVDSDIEWEVMSVAAVGSEKVGGE
jgi:hypothetical protein